LSRERPSKAAGRQEDIPLQDEEVAYVFGRQGTTKDKLARVSGTNIELQGSSLVIQGEDQAIERAKKYVKILLDQRKGALSDPESSGVHINPKDHPDDLCLVSVPNDCKGFVTGRRGDTLRTIDRECATLMTFCKSEGEDGETREPLAIFGTRRGRLLAQLKVMSIVEGKHEGWFIKDNTPPEMTHLQADLDEGGDWGVDFMELDPKTLGYALGKGGNTRHKLEIASGCIIQYIGMWSAFGGTKEERKRGQTYLEWLINQRNHDFQVDVSERTDVSVLYVPEPSVGYVTGVKAQTLRNLEQKSGTFCFFDKRRSGHSKEKMLIFSHSKKNRERAVDEVKLIVNFHQNKIGGKARCTTSFHGSDGSRSGGSASQSRSRSRRRSRSRTRSPRKSTESPKRSLTPEKGARSRSRSYERTKKEK